MNDWLRALGIMTAALVAVRLMRREWTPPPAAAPYLATIQAAEGQYAIPQNLLARLLYQESRFREDVIRGDVVSSAGAVGIAQIVPRWHPTVDPRDPYASIWYAARYLAGLRAQFGAWELALAAYNWGPGNLSTALEGPRPWVAMAPRETLEYVAAIASDVPPGGGAMPA